MKTGSARGRKRATKDGPGAGQPQRERRRWPWQRLVIAAALIYFAVTFVAQETQFAGLRQEIYRLQGEIGLRQAELEALRERRDYLQSAEYIEAEARRRFNLARPGEIHYLTTWEESEPDDNTSTGDSASTGDNTSDSASTGDNTSDSASTGDNTSTGSAVDPTSP